MIADSHSCRVCGKRFRSQRELERHGTAHIGNKQYKCGVCRKGFNILYYLKQHTKVVHYGFLPYSCGFCRDKFQTNYFLKKHLTEKHPESPYTCTLCEKIFINAAALLQHERSVHKE